MLPPYGSLYWKLLRPVAEGIPMIHEHGLFAGFGLYLGLGIAVVMGLFRSRRLVKEQSALLAACLFYESLARGR